MHEIINSESLGLILNGQSLKDIEIENTTDFKQYFIAGPFFSVSYKIELDSPRALATNRYATGFLYAHDGNGWNRVIRRTVHSHYSMSKGSTLREDNYNFDSSDNSSLTAFTVSSVPYYNNNSGTARGSSYYYAVRQAKNESDKKTSFDTSDGWTIQTGKDKSHRIISGKYGIPKDYDINWKGEKICGLKTNYGSCSIGSPVLEFSDVEKVDEDDNNYYQYCYINDFNVNTSGIKSAIGSTSVDSTYRGSYVYSYDAKNAFTLKLYEKL